MAVDAEEELIYNPEHWMRIIGNKCAKEGTEGHSTSDTKTHSGRNKKERILTMELKGTFLVPRK